MSTPHPPAWPPPPLDVHRILGLTANDLRYRLLFELQAVLEGLTEGEAGETLARIKLLLVADESRPWRWSDYNERCTLLMNRYNTKYR